MVIRCITRSDGGGGGGGGGGGVLHHFWCTPGLLPAVPESIARILI